MSSGMGAPRVVLMRGRHGGVSAVADELAARAQRWASAVAAERVVEASVGVGATVADLFEHEAGPVLVAWPELVRWSENHAAGALGDLADGCGLTVGPLFDGGLYLAGFARAIPKLLALPDDAWLASDPLRLVAGVAHDEDFSVGLLRTERGLRTPADVTALLADPLLDEDLRRLLG